MKGIAAMTMRESAGLVATIMARAPRNRMALRRNSDAVEPTAAFTCVVSAARRETISPESAVS